MDLRNGYIINGKFYYSKLFMVGSTSILNAIFPIDFNSDVLFYTISTNRIPFVDVYLVPSFIKIR